MAASRLIGERAGNVRSVPDHPTDRKADTRVPIHPPIAARWSPRAFDPERDVSTEQVTALLEAARWAPTWGRRQPVRFVVGVRGDAAFTTLSGLLSRGNAYAKAAATLILFSTDEGDDEDSARYAALDAGSAMENLLIEAFSRDLVAHPMAGFDADGVREQFDITDPVRPLVMVAVGWPADYNQMSDEVAERDNAPRKRSPLESVVLNWSSVLGTALM